MRNGAVSKGYSGARTKLDRKSACTQWLVLIVVSGSSGQTKCLRPVKADKACYPSLLLEFTILLLKTHSKFHQTRYALFKRRFSKTLSLILSGEGLNEDE